MKPLLSVLFVDSHSEYLKAKTNILDIQDGMVELISLSSNGFIKDVDKLNYITKMANGLYISIVREGDILLSGFFDEVLDGIRTKRDAIVFDSVSGDGEQRKYTSILRKRANFSAKDDLYNIQYFHVIKRTLMFNVMFSDIDRNRDIFSFFSKKISQAIFSEYNIDKTLIQHDPV